MHGNEIVVFACQDKICILKTIHELEVITDPEQPSTIIPIKNGNFFKKVIPESDPYTSAELRSLHTISEGSVFPIGFEYKYYQGEIRQIGYLELDIAKGVAQWIDFKGITEKELFPGRSYNYAGENLIKYDSALMKGDDVYFFCPGAKMSSVNKWGMDWHALWRTDRQEKIKDILLDSGDLGLIDQKKRGVHGVFSYSGRYVILTPHFNSDEWRGKQKLFDLSTCELVDIQMPRGLAKGLILQHTGTGFWVSSNNDENFYLALCEEV
ncbi:MAG: hypothetical protein LIP01_05840 [Tannerellaceae bacterium]|nr:hypothetical protein [Tannerellaceae bacterium]